MGGAHWRPQLGRFLNFRPAPERISDGLPFEQQEQKGANAKNSKKTRIARRFRPRGTSDVDFLFLNIAATAIAKDGLHVMFKDIGGRGKSIGVTPIRPEQFIATSAPDPQIQPIQSRPDIDSHKEGHGRSEHRLATSRSFSSHTRSALAPPDSSSGRSCSDTEYIQSSRNRYKRKRSVLTSARKSRTKSPPIASQESYRSLPPAGTCLQQIPPPRSVVRHFSLDPQE